MNLRFKPAIAAICIVSFSAFIGTSLQQKPWPVPDAAKNKKNPVALNDASIATGKTLWGTHCKSCHGTKGLGDGPKASQLSTDPGDFTKTSFQTETDGALFYKTAEGRDDMPGFKTKIANANDIWALVNYMRSLKKGGITPTTPTTPTTPVKDTVKKVEKPVVVTPPPVKKDTLKKVNPPVIKSDSLAVSVQEQITRLAIRVDSLERLLNSVKARVDTLK